VGARKTIANWPRGKSTTSPMASRWECADDVCGFPYYLTPDTQLDLLFDKLYHRQQQLMVDRWHENYREGYYKQSIVFANLR
jgi:hypothetical protein